MRSKTIKKTFYQQAHNFSYLPNYQLFILNLNRVVNKKNENIAPNKKTVINRQVLNFAVFCQNLG
ncbi:hypothetical protein BKM63_19665 [Flavobacterium johnsoniae]|uniref:Uncharacterized protein n=1 Tax=Flavobacterium johnsoniae TaxID=986 RepID=A0A1J7CF72_FLAJO|nr:hypothetical protein BKM63_19665 [Flavobacterium johnsoniae]